MVHNWILIFLFHATIYLQKSSYIQVAEKRLFIMDWRGLYSYSSFSLPYMVQAYQYKILQSGDCFWIFINEAVFATIDKAGNKSWHLNILSSGDHFVLKPSGFRNRLLQIYNTNANLEVAKMVKPLFASVFNKVKLIYPDGTKLLWGMKGPLSFHWEWRQPDNLMLEALEEISVGNHAGIIAVSRFDEKSNLLILLGCYLSLMYKRSLTMGISGLKRQQIPDALQY
jgi:hypothetical protein